MDSSQITAVLLALAMLIGAARLFGELARWVRQPAILGELLAGVLLGPTVFGSLLPTWHAFLFPEQGPAATVLDGIGTLAIVLFLLVAGIEVDLSTIFRQGRAALKVGVLGTVVPFLLGFAAAWLLPMAMGREPDADPLIFALFVATAMSISALPVIAKTLMDLNLYRTDLGMVVVSAAIFNDLIGWTVFALILGMMSAQGSDVQVLWTVVMTLLFAGLMLTAGRWVVHRLLPPLQAYTHWPGGVLTFAVTLALCGAALTEWIGIHAIFGSFLVGIALGDSPHLQERTRVMLDEFISFIFAPVFFASIGLHVNFGAHFDLQLVVLVLALGCACKLLGAVAGARWGGMPRRDSLAVGFAMNARGAMEIILGLLALEAGVISQRLFVALVVLAIVTSAMSGPLIRWILQRQQPRRIIPLVSPRLFERRMAAASSREAIHELVQIACNGSSLELSNVEQLTWEREELAATGIGHGVALPHARLATLKEPIVAIGLSEAGIAFDAPDGQPAHVVFLMLTPRGEPAAQLELSANVAQMFRDPRSLDRVMRATTFTEFLAALNALEARARTGQG